MAGAFLTADFLTAAFLTGAFFAGAFFAGAFFTGAFFAAAFFAGANGWSPGIDLPSTAENPSSSAMSNCLGSGIAASSLLIPIEARPL